jgi:serine/threonine protein phosphatase PrpC
MMWTINSGVVSDVGLKRTGNEDCGRVIHPGDAAGLERCGVLAIVADGMGGHSGGEVASQLAVDTIHRVYFAADDEPHASLTRALTDANTAIFDRASTDASLQGMGTTCVALVVREGLAYAASIGDSRIYLLREDRIYQMTADDSAVGEMVNQGLLSRGEARHHQDRNVILKALGTHPDVTVATWQQPFPVRAGDTFLLCSDGLTDLVEDHELLELASGGHVSDACHRLVDLAKARGGFDNITVAVLRVAPAASERAVPTTREAQVIS